MKGEFIMRTKKFFTNSTTFDLNYLFDKPKNTSFRNHNDLKDEEKNNIFDTEKLSK